jgi:arylsulfatase A-like enzyme
VIHTTSRNVGRHVDARRALGHLAALLLAPLLAPLTTLPAADRPNIVLILADDMGWRDAGCFGGKAAPTPHLDELAASGVKMTRFYAASAVCTPTRASILTGRHPLRFDIRAIFPDDESHLPRGTVTLPALLKAHGYGTAHVGKWHLGGLHAAHAKHRAASIPGPREHGFDHYLSQIEEEPPRRTMGRERRLYREGGTCLLRDDEPVPEDDPYFRMHLTDIIGAESIRLVEQFHREKKPFFLNIWHLVPHAPYEPGSEPSWTNTAARGISDDQHRFRSMMAHMDATIGALLRRLDELGLRENTLVIFTSDNGGAYESDLGPLELARPHPRGGRQRLRRPHERPVAHALRRRRRARARRGAGGRRRPARALAGPDGRGPRRPVGVAAGSDAGHPASSRQAGAPCHRGGDGWHMEAPLP